MKRIRSDKREGKNMSDYMIRATAAGEQIRAFAITSRELVEYARQSHDTAPVVTAALGRTLSAAAMMGFTMKNDTDLMTLQIQGEGPLKGVTCTADNKGNVKGFPLNPYVDIPPRADGKLDVGGAVGPGVLRVIMDIGLKDPYVGTVELQTGEIAEDLTYYYAVSEQVPSSVGLGVLVDTDLSVICAGGFIVQLMPFTSDEVIDRLEENIRNLPSVTDMLSGRASDEGKELTPEDILGKVLDGFDISINETIPVRFKCDCSVERVERSLISLSDEDLDSIIEDDKPVEVRCQFCNKAYNFTTEDIKSIKMSRKPR